MLRSDLCDYFDVYIAVKGTITVTEPDNAKKSKAPAFKIMHHSSIASEKLREKKLIMQKF